MSPLDLWMIKKAPQPTSVMHVTSMLPKCHELFKCHHKHGEWMEWWIEGNHHSRRKTDKPLQWCIESLVELVDNSLWFHKTVLVLCTQLLISYSFIALLDEWGQKKILNVAKWLRETAKSFQIYSSASSSSTWP